MIVGIGVDVCSVERFRTMVERRRGVLDKIFNPGEWAAVSIESQAARFAAKEALAKSLGSPGGLNWLDAEVVSLESGKPTIVVRGTVARLADSLGVTRFHLSLSHDAGVATAFVIAES